MSSREITERAKFYLKHRQRIEEWAKLESAVASEAHGFYCSLKAPLAVAAGDLAECMVFTHLSRTEPPKVFLHRAGWWPQTSDSHPAVGIGLEYPHKKTSFTNAYIGIWVNRISPHNRQLADKLGPLIAGRAPQVLPNTATKTTPGRYRLSKTGWFPLHQTVTPHQTDYWNDLDGYADALIAQIVELWNDMSEPVQQALDEAQENPPA